MKSLTRLLENILKDMSVRCGTDTQKDYNTLALRVKDEGISFFTITLAEFGSDFERSLDLGSIVRGSFPSFKKMKKGGLIPCFLSGITGQVFDIETGVLLNEPNIDCIISIRQLCLMTKKAKIECSDERKAKAFYKFVQIEQELATLPGTYSLSGKRFPSRESDYQLKEGRKEVLTLNYCDDLFREVSNILWTPVFERIHQNYLDGTFFPKQGPGASADKIQGNAKFVFTSWPKRFEEYYPFSKFGVVNQTYLKDALEHVTFLDPDLDYPVKVIQVPKTLKGPRVIAMESVAVQFMQQAMLYQIVNDLETSPITKGCINFSDQSLNAKEALRSSKSGRKATIDLSDASDRVHVQWVELMLNSGKVDYFSFLKPLRTPTAELPGGITIALSKFASMGSALCFPILSMFIMTILIVAWHAEKKRSVSENSVHKSIRAFKVYGDDIICPVHLVPTVLDALELFGLKVNTKKSFWTGKFRESCGTDAYDGINVTPVYLREVFPEDGTDVQKLPSMVALANQLYLKGWWGTAAYVRAETVRLFGPIPHVHREAPCLGWISFQDRYSFERWSRERHAPLVRAYCVSPKRTKQTIPGFAMLLKTLLEKPGDAEVKDRFSQSLHGLGVLESDISTSDPMHLERYTRPRHVNIKRRWVQPF